MNTQQAKKKKAIPAFVYFMRNFSAYNTKCKQPENSERFSSFKRCSNGTERHALRHMYMHILALKPDPITENSMVGYEFCELCWASNAVKFELEII